MKGPIPWAWVTAAARLPGPGFVVALGVRCVRGRSRGEARRSVADLASALGVADRSVQRGLRAAEEAGLVAVDRPPGRKPLLRVVEPGGGSGAGSRPLRGPIPWGWWRSATDAGGPASRVGIACWALAGWEGSASFPLALGEWADLGLSPRSASRGLAALESARLVDVETRPGRPPLARLRTPGRAGRSLTDGATDIGGETARKNALDREGFGRV